MRLFPELSNKQKGLITSILLLPALFLNLGMQPLYLEEPRRALIALEMMIRGNFIVPTEFGLNYFNKPPLWNWIIIIGLKLFKNNPELGTRIFSVIFFLFSGFVLFLISKKYVNSVFAFLATFFYLISADIFFYFSMLGEIDLFYSSITFISFMILFHFYYSNKFYWAFILFYILNAAGVLTKGLPSFAFTALTLFTLIALNKDYKRLLSLPNIIGILIFTLLIGSYFYAYSKQYDLKLYITTLFNESSKRTPILSENLIKLIKHLLIFPLDIIKNILPASIFIPLIFKKNFLQIVKQNKFIWYVFLVFIINIILYWISPGTKQRYIYMLYPLIICVIAYFYINDPGNKKRYYRFLGFFLYASIITIILTSIIVPFVKQFKDIHNLPIISVFLVIVLIYLLLYFHNNKNTLPWIFIWLFIIIRIVYNYTVIPYRVDHGHSSEMRDHSYKIASIIQNEDIKIYKLNKPVCSRTTVFYLENEIKKIVHVEDSEKKDCYYIADTSLICHKAYNIYYSFKDKPDENYHLIKFKH